MAEKTWAELMAEAGGGFEPVPDGDYDVTVLSSEFKLASTGKKMWKLTHQITTGPYAGRRVFDQLVLTTDNPNAVSYFFAHMAAMGLDANFFAANPSDEQIAQALMNRPSRVKVGHRTWQGKPQNDVKAYSAPGTAATIATPPVAGVPSIPPPAPAPAPPMAPAPAPAPAPPAAPVAPPPASPVAPPVAAPVAPAPEAPVSAPPPAAPPVPVAPVAPPVAPPVPDLPPEAPAVPPPPF